MPELNRGCAKAVAAMRSAKRRMAESLAGVRSQKPECVAGGCGEQGVGIHYSFMETKLVYQPFDKIEADAATAVLFEDEAAPAELKFAAAWLDELRGSGEFAGKADEMAVSHQPAGIRSKRLVVIGGGKRAGFDLRKAVA